MENNISILVDKYFDNQTSLEEEAVLVEYFNGDNVAENLLPFQAIFEFVSEERMITLGSSFDTKVLNSIKSQSNIPALLDKYFEEQTSTEEEILLREYFNGKDVAPDLMIYKSIFEFVKEEQTLKVSANFDANLMERIQQNEMQLLVDKYFEGETTLEEEKELQTYFNSNKVAADLMKFQAMFIFIKEEKTKAVSSDFEARVMKEIKGKSAGLKVVSRRSQALRVAAGVALLIGMFFTLQNLMSTNGQGSVATTEPKTIDWAKYEVQTEAEATAEMEEAMRILAKAFNKGSKKATKDLKKVGDATKVLN